MSASTKQLFFYGCVVCACLVTVTARSEDFLTEREIDLAKRFSQTHVPVYLGKSWCFIQSVKSKDGTAFHGLIGFFKEVKRSINDRIYYGKENENWEILVDENSRKTFSVPRGYDLYGLWSPSIAILIAPPFLPGSLQRPCQLYNIEKKEFLSEFLCDVMLGDYPHFAGLEITREYFESDFKDKEAYKKSQILFFDVITGETKRIAAFKGDEHYYYFGACDGVIGLNISKSHADRTESRFLCNKNLVRLFQIDKADPGRGWRFMENTRNSFNSVPGIVSDDVLLLMRDAWPQPDNYEFGAVDKSGRYLFKEFYCKHIYSFHDGMARFERDGKTGYIDKTGKEVVPAKYLKGTDFHQGRAFVLSEEIKIDSDAHPATPKTIVNRTYEIKTDGTITRQQWNPDGYINSLHHHVVLVRNLSDGENISWTVYTLEGDKIVEPSDLEMKKLLDCDLIENN